MINWCRQKTLFVLVVCSCWSKAVPAVFAVPTPVPFKPNTNSFLSQIFNRTQPPDPEPLECQEINPIYQEIYSFETENYLISICQLDNNFYYHRQSKLNPRDKVMIAAQAVYRGNVFQASDGKTTYFVGKNGDRHYSSMMSNDNEIVFEPELPSSDNQLSQELAEANSNLSQERKLNQAENASLELDNSQEDSEQVLICTREKSTFHPRLDGWHKLIGKSTNAANRYANHNGYDFIYNQQTPNIASIITKEGVVINLSITNPRKIIEKVCIQPTASTN